MFINLYNKINLYYLDLYDLYNKKFYLIEKIIYNRLIFYLEKQKLINIILNKNN